jgi:hypothetical protein
MPRKQYTYHYIYKTTCKVNGKYYVGMHSTSNLEDGYIGSGKRLWNSIKKHGRDNHSIEILEWFPDRSSLKNREKELVNESLLQDPMCMNLQLGGGGGFSSEEHQKKCSFAGNLFKKTLQGRENRRKLATELWKKESFRENVSASLKGNQGFNGKTHSEEARNKISFAMSNKQKGELNSQFGTVWITNGEKNKKMKKTETLPEGWSFGRN